MTTKTKEETSDILDNVDETNFAKTKKTMHEKQRTSKNSETTT